MFYNLEDKKIKNSGDNWSAPNASIIGDVNLEKNTNRIVYLKLIKIQS